VNGNSTQVWVMVCLVNMSCLWPICAPFCLQFALIVFFVLHMDFTLNSQLSIHHNPILELSCLFYVKTKEHTLNLHSTTKSKINHLWAFFLSFILLDKPKGMSWKYISQMKQRVCGCLDYLASKTCECWDLRPFKLQFKLLSILIL